MSAKHDTRLTFVSNTKSGRAIYRCVCGVEKELDIGNVERGTTWSCGCLKREMVAKFNTETKTKHGLAGTPLYQVWQGAKQRCINPKHKKWKDYGGRGITMCARLQESFNNFVECVGPRPEDKTTIDRIDNNGGYWCGRSECPDCAAAKHQCNLRWVVSKVSGNNRRTNRPVTWNGKTQSVTMWAEELGMDPATLIGRLNRNWGVERALSTPARAYTKRTDEE